MDDKMSTASGSATDPALETDAHGRTLLQSRIGLYGKVMFLLSLAFWPGFFGLWFGEPSAWTSSMFPRRTLLASASFNSVVYLFIWWFGRGRPRSARALYIFDGTAMLVLGACFAMHGFSHASPHFSVLESVLAIMLVLLSPQLHWKYSAGQPSAMNTRPLCRGSGHQLGCT